MSCWGCGAETAGADFCLGSGRLQPGSDTDRDLFRALGFSSPQLTIDPVRLEERFHAKSRLFHPDRYQRKDPKELQISLERSALVNEAYRTLKDPKSRVRYVLERFGGGEGEPKEVPAELAEIYFELQEQLTESEGAAGLADFRIELVRRRETFPRQLEEVCRAWDASELPPVQRGELLQLLRDLLHQDNYAASMLRDLEKRMEGKSP
jgi:molecular chaperone HscB